MVDCRKEGGGRGREEGGEEEGGWKILQTEDMTHFSLECVYSHGHF